MLLAFEIIWVWLLFDDDQVCAKLSTWHQGGCSMAA